MLLLLDIVNFLVDTIQQTRHIDLMFDQCWAEVVDGGPTLVQHLFYVSCLLGTQLTETLIQCWFIVDSGPTVNQQWINVSGLLGKTTLFLIVVLSATKPLSLKELTLPPFTLFPHPVPEECYNKAYQVQQSYNLLYHKVAHDYQFLESALSK